MYARPPRSSVKAETSYGQRPALSSRNAPRNAWGTLPGLSFGHVDRYGPGPMDFMDSTDALEDCYV